MIIYPSNINLNRSKKEGRKISKKHAAPDPSVKEMFMALQSLGENNVKIENEAAYPRRHWEQAGRVVVETKGGKIMFMKKMAKEIKRMRTVS